MPSFIDVSSVSLLCETPGQPVSVERALPQFSVLKVLDNFFACLSINYMDYKHIFRFCLLIFLLKCHVCKCSIVEKNDSLNYSLNKSPRLLQDIQTSEVISPSVFDTLDTTGDDSASKKLYRARLFGSVFKYAYYFMDVLVGTPPKRVSVILDTGSSLLAFPCKGCIECGKHLDGPINPTSSTTYEWIDCRDTSRCFGTCAATERYGTVDEGRRCMYSQSYSEGSSIWGFNLSDMVSIGNIDQKNPQVRYDHIGCHIQETDLFITQKATGIFGLSFPKGSGQPTLIDIMFKNESLVRKPMFSICISEDGGLFTVGGYEESLILKVGTKAASNMTESEALASAQKISYMEDLSSTIIWTRFLSRVSYTVKILSMTVNGVVLGGDDSEFGKVLIDSGTTFSYFPPKVFKRWRKELEKYCTAATFCQRERDSRPCWRITSSKMLRDMFPTIIIEFWEGEKLVWTPESYLYRRTGGFWCDGMDNNETNSSVLGLSFFKYKQMIFDRKNDMLGIVNARCPSFFLEERPSSPDDKTDISHVFKVDLAPESLPAPLDIVPQVERSNSYIYELTAGELYWDYCYKFGFQVFNIMLVVFSVVFLVLFVRRRYTNGSGSVPLVASLDTEQNEPSCCVTASNSVSERDHLTNIDGGLNKSGLVDV